MRTDGIEAYRLGREYTIMPIPMEPEHCVEVAAGPIVLVAEARWLSAERVREHASRSGQSDQIDDVEGLEDSGPSIHVLDAVERIEHLRFDCFEHEPHYHYIDQAAGINTVVRIDDIAEGDPLAWALGRLRSRLPEMLQFVGRDDLADRVRFDHPVIRRSIDELERVLAESEPSRTPIT